MKKFAIARPGYAFVFVPAVLGIVFLTFFPLLSYLFFAITIFFAYFFRDPPRVIPEVPGGIVSPADGRVLKVEKVHEPLFLKEDAWKITIFLSVFDVHINRSPCESEVLLHRYIPGKFRPAYEEGISNQNERNLIGLKGEDGKYLVVQIAGIVARRIICWVRVGDTLERGARIGMIRFGSCTELYMPLSARINVKEGEHVRGGETILGKNEA